ncbi:MAG: hypothetical protein ACRDMV_02230 [Streptosporangiales bacterium]
MLTNGLLVLLGTIALPALLGRWGNGRLLVPLTLAWIGTAVAVMSGPTHIAVSNHGHASPLLVTAAILATLSGLVLTGSAARILTRPG